MTSLGAIAGAVAELGYQRARAPARALLPLEPVPPATVTAKAACNLCEAICGITVTAANGKITAITGDPADPLSRGYVCPKSIALADIYHDQDRLRTPVRRVGTQWQPVSWKEAIEYTAGELARLRRTGGADSVGVYLGNPVVHSLGAMTHGQTLAGMLGTRNHFSATSVDQLPHQLVSSLMYGHQLLLPEPDLERTQYFLIFGANPRASNGSMMTAPDMPRRLREIRERGGKVIVVDPRRTETAAAADEHIFIRPGTDAAVLAAMVRLILAEGLARPADFCPDLDQLRAAVAQFTPAVASRLSGVPAGKIVELARAYASADGAACYGRIGVSTQRYGTLAHWAIQVLNAITANLGRSGGTLFTDPAIDLLALTGRGGFGRQRSRVRGLPSFAGEFPVAALAEEIRTPGPGQIRGLLTVSGNPVLSTPGGAELDSALAQLDFMVSVDFYINETTRHADIILPPVSALERDHYDLVFRAFGVRNTAKFSPPVVPKNTAAKDDWEIFRDLGLAYERRLAGSRLAQLRALASTRKLAAQVRLRLSPRELIDLLLRTGPRRLSVRQLLARPSGIDLGQLQTGVRQKLRTPDRKVVLVPEPIVAGLATLWAELNSAPECPELPLRLIGRRHMRSNNSWMHNYGRLVSGPPRHQLLMHPGDAARLGVADGPARLRSRVGSIRVDVTQTSDIMEGTVSLPHGFGHTGRSTRLRVASKVAGQSVNDVTDPDWLDEISGNAAFSGLPVTVGPLGPDDE